MYNTPDARPETKQAVEEVVATLPKVVLHDHLDGGLRPGTIAELAAECGYDQLPTTDPDELATWFVQAANSGSLPKYLETFQHTTAVMQTRDALIRVTREAIEDLAADNVVYAELRYAPELHLAGGLSMREVVEATIAGCAEGEQAAAEAGKDITARLILTGMRHGDNTEAVAELTADAVADWDLDNYVVGFDIAGAEDGFPASGHAAAFATLRERLVPFTIHAGEAAGLESIKQAVQLGAARIGHGARLYEDFSASDLCIELSQVSSYIRDRRIPLELCPTSNVQTGVCDDIADHPFPLLFDLGFTCTINTDNRLVSGTTMTKEMMLLVDTFDYGYPELFQLTANAIDNAFADLPTRERIMDTVVYPAYMALADADGDGEIDSTDAEELHLSMD